jgi:hypothetical protein
MTNNHLCDVTTEGTRLIGLKWNSDDPFFFNLYQSIMIELGYEHGIYI